MSRHPFSLLLIVLLQLLVGSGGLKAQTVIRMPIQQNPPFSVIAPTLSIVLPDGGITLGADVVVTGGSGNYSYSWLDADGKVLSTEPTLHVTTPGNYTLSVSDECQCEHQVTFSLTPSALASVYTSEALRIYPNPTHGEVWLSARSGIVQIAAIDMQGRLQRVAACPQQEELTRFDLSKLPAGSYILQCRRQDGALLVQTIQKL